MAAGGMPHAVLIVGPPAVGKTTLALDIAAALLCTEVPASRPCGGCRACRMVDSGNHPDLHRIAPEGPGGQIRIDAIRRLVGELALLPVEGGARVALIEAAHRLNEDAQNALLKTLEEPPAGVTIILCADDEDRLLPTVRSRCARIRLGPVATRAVEELLVAQGVADAHRAARLAHLAGGRPGLALAYGRSPEAVSARSEIARSLIDVLEQGRSTRMTRARELLTRAGELAAALAAGPATVPGVGAGDRGAVQEATGSGSSPEAARVPAAERRRAAFMLLDIARDLVHDLALAEGGEISGLRDPGLADDLTSAAGRLPPGWAGDALARIVRTGELLESNVAPELAVDVLLLRWPRLSAPNAA